MTALTEALVGGSDAEAEVAVVAGEGEVPCMLLGKSALRTGDEALAGGLETKRGAS